MPNIRPISDLRNRTDEISRLAHEDDEPVFVTKNGRDNLVVMSQAHYDRLLALMELTEKLGEAETAAASGGRRIPHAELMVELRRRVRGA